MAEHRLASFRSISDCSDRSGARARGRPSLAPALVCYDVHMSSQANDIFPGRDWLIDQLSKVHRAQVDERIMMATSASTSGPLLGLGWQQWWNILDPIIAKAEPCLWTPPKGKPIEGSTLPQEMIDFSVSKAEIDARHGDGTSKQGLCGGIFEISLRLAKDIPWARTRPRLKWLLASGFDPLRYNEDVGRVPVSTMAVTGQVEMLSFCRRLGVDLRLPVEKHHFPDADESKFLTVIGTHLLHRICMQYRIVKRPHEVIEELVRAGMHPLDRNINGATALDFASTPECEAKLREVIAKTQAKRLNTTSAKAPAPGNHRRRL